MRGVKSMAGPTLEADSENILRAITPTLDQSIHKGQAGKIAVIGGCRGCVSRIMKRASESSIPIVADGVGFFLVTNCLDLVSGYPLAVLTPNVNEYKHLIQKVLNSEVNDEDTHGIGGVTILRKGKSDLITDGKMVKSVSIYGSPRRCAGQGDILSGRQSKILGSIAGSTLLRKAASLALKDKKRSTLTADIIEYLGRSLEDICPVNRCC